MNMPLLGQEHRPKRRPKAVSTRRRSTLGGNSVPAWALKRGSIRIPGSPSAEAEVEARKRLVAWGEKRRMVMKERFAAALGVVHYPLRQQRRKNDADRGASGYTEYYADFEEAQDANAQPDRWP